MCECVSERTKQCVDFSTNHKKQKTEDLFSSDLSEDELKLQNGHVALLGVDSCCVLSGADEYVPNELKKNYDLFGQKLSSSLGGDYCVIDGGDHGLSKSEHSEKFIEVVISKLKRMK